MVEADLKEARLNLPKVISISILILLNFTHIWLVWVWNFFIHLLILPRLTSVAIIFRVWRLLTKTHIKKKTTCFTCFKVRQDIFKFYAFSLRSHFTYDKNVVPLSLQKLERRQLHKLLFFFFFFLNIYLHSRGAHQLKRNYSGIALCGAFPCIFRLWWKNYGHKSQKQIRFQLVN